MRHFYLLLLGLISVLGGSAQVLVTSSAGTTAATNYTNLKAAFDAINNGIHQGSINIAITADVTETATASINASGLGNATYTSILIQPSGIRTLAGNIAGALIELNGADSVTIKGGSSNLDSLTIVNEYSLSAVGASTVLFINDASNNLLQNLRILGASNTGSSGTVFFSTGTTSGNNNNVVSANYIGAANTGTPSVGVYAAGSTMANTSNQVLDNQVADYFHAAQTAAGIILSTGNEGWNISGNSLFQTVNRTYTTAGIQRAIYIGGGNAHTVSNNIIGYSDPAGTGVYSMSGNVALRFIGIELAVGSNNSSDVHGNILSNISLATTANSSATTVTGVWCGIFVSAGDVNVGKAGQGNMIGSIAANGSIAISPTVNGAYVVAIASSSSDSVSITHNTVAGISLTPGGVNAGTVAAIASGGAGGNVFIDQNTIGSSLAHSLSVGTQGVTTQGGIARGIINTATGTAVITNNTIQNLTNHGSGATSLFRGIESQGGTGRIGSNILREIKTGGAIANFSTQSGIGILVNSTSTGVSIDSNTIYNLHLTGTGTTGAVISGIFAGNASATSGLTNGINITRNKIYGLTNGHQSLSATAPSTVVGIFLGNANTANPMLIANNMVALGSAQANNNAFIGIWHYYTSSSAYTAKIYHNTVHITGTAASGEQPSYAYQRGNFSTTAPTTPIVDIKNNIFTNFRSGGTGRHIAIANGSPSAGTAAGGWPTNASNYNIIFSASEQMAFWNAFVSFAAWQTASGGDGQSINGTMPEYIDPSADLHLNPAFNGSLDNKGTPLTDVTTDIDQETRSVATPDIGADEFTYNATLPVSLVYFNGKANGTKHELAWLVKCNSTSIRFELQRGKTPGEMLLLQTLFAQAEACKDEFRVQDENPLPGLSYYRLKMIDADGNVSYSSLIMIKADQAGSEIYLSSATVVRKEAMISIRNAQVTTLGISVIDGGGRLLTHSRITIPAGHTTLPVNLAKMAAGIYYVVVEKSQEGRHTFRVVKE